MRSTGTPAWHPLFQRIVAALKDGGRITASVRDYIASSLFAPDPQRLNGFLSNDTGSERDSLLDLIFYPDMGIQLELEPMLASLKCSPADEAALLDGLLNRAIDATVRLPDGQPLVRIRLPDFIKAQFLDRLNIAWQMDPQVAAALEANVSADSQLQIKVRLRNAALPPTANRDRFLSRLFERMPNDSPDYLDCLELVLPLLASAKADANVYDLLVERKRNLYRSLMQARRFEGLLARSNMETLMLQGIRPPQVAASILRQEMRLIDSICLGAYGKTETIAPPIEGPTQHISDLRTPEAVVKSLLG
ncbi:MAG: hypothetical protein PVH26_02440 [Desulfosarcina sp.]|jgi:hypothetical protein